MKILILGGTAFLGYHTVQAALERGHEVTLFNRGKTDARAFGDQVEYLVGDRDPKDPSGVGGLGALEGSREWDAVLDCTGYVPRLVKASGDLLRDRCATYLFVSTISVYAEPLPLGADESAPHLTMDDPTDEDVAANYGALKSLCETAITASCGDKAVIVRPGIIAGPNDYTDRFSYWADAAANAGENMLCPGTPDAPVQAIDVRDLATWMVLLLESKTRGTFNACGPTNTCTFGDLIEACLAGADSSATAQWIPWEFLEASDVKPWVDMPLCIPIGVQGSTSLGMSSALAYAAGLEIRPLADTARDTLKWLQEDLPKRKNRSLRTGLDRDKSEVALGSWLSAQGE